MSVAPDASNSQGTRTSSTFSSGDARGSQPSISRSPSGDTDPDLLSAVNAEVVAAATAIVDSFRRGTITLYEASVRLHEKLPPSSHGRVAFREFMRQCAESLEERDRAAKSGNPPAGRALQMDQGQEREGAEDETGGSDHERANRSGGRDTGGDNGSVGGDGEPGITSTTKRSLDESKLPWFNKAEPKLDSCVQRRLERKREYLVDVKRVKQLILSRVDAPAFPESQWEVVIRSGHLDFNKLFSDRYSLGADAKVTQKLGEFEVSFPGESSAKPTKSIASHGDWLHAFSIAKKAILYLYPERGDELDSYAEFIGRQFAATRPSEHRRVINLDQAICRRHAQDNRSSLADVGSFMDLYTQHMHSIGAGSDAQRTSSKRTYPGGEVPTCNRFNDRTCTSVTCTYRHVCTKCQGDHPQKACPDKRGGQRRI